MSIPYLFRKNGSLDPGTYGGIVFSKEPGLKVVWRKELLMVMVMAMVVMVMVMVMMMVMVVILVMMMKMRTSFIDRYILKQHFQPTSEPRIWAQSINPISQLMRQKFPSQNPSPPYAV